MHHFSIPTCYFPSTALFIDDNRDFLLNFVLQLDEWLAYRVFDSPFDALHSIQKKHLEDGLVSQRSLANYKARKKQPLSQVNECLVAVQAETANPRRFNDISVVVVDYAMPGMDGLELCRRIHATPIKKILLTAKADERLAIAAFNEGLIHRYIHKDDPDVTELITQSIDDLQWQYFQDMSDRISRLLSLTSPPCLHNTAFMNFFREFVDQKGVVEFYLADDSGSFLLLDVDAKPSYLLIKTEEELSSYCTLAEQQGVSSTIVTQLKNRERLPLMAYHECLQSAQWSRNLTPASRLSAEGIDYFYAWVKKPLLQGYPNNVKSYHCHLQEIDAEELLLV